MYQTCQNHSLVDNIDYIEKSYINPILFRIFHQLVVFVYTLLFDLNNNNNNNNNTMPCFSSVVLIKIILWKYY